MSQGGGALAAIMSAGYVCLATAGVCGEMILRPVQHGLPHSKTAASAPPLPAPATSDSLRLNQMAEIYPTLCCGFQFGDTDHDTKNEVLLATRDPKDPYVYNYRVLEEQGNDVYQDVYVGSYFDPYAVGDFDQDGKSEILGQYGYELRIYESIDPFSHPSQLVWSWQNPTNVGSFDVVGDTDRDGKMEIIHSLSTFTSSRLVIFENTGDNSFDLVYDAMTWDPQAASEKVIADLDGDGLTEIAFSGHRGLVYVYESTADNTWRRVWADVTGLYDAYGVEGGRDTDGNGMPEFFVAGSYWDYPAPEGVPYYATLVYEATGDNEYAQVAKLVFNDGSNGAGVNALGDLDGDGSVEYLTQGNGYFWIYRASAAGSWDPIAHVEDPDPRGVHVGLYVFDVNRNGRAEVFWETNAIDVNSLVLEHQRVSDADSVHFGDPPMFRVLPNPCRGEAVLLGADAARSASELFVYDVAGRLVRREPVLRNAMERLVWRPGRLPPGVYFLRLRAQGREFQASARATLIR